MVTVNSGELQTAVGIEEGWRLGQIMAGWQAIARGAFPTDCRKIVQMIEETDSLRLWERSEFGGFGPWPDRDSFLADQVLLDPNLIQPVYDALLILDPDHAVPLKEAVSKAEKAHDYKAANPNATQQQVAEAVGCTQGRVSQLLKNGVYTPKINNPKPKRQVLQYKITQYTKPETAAKRIIEKFGDDFAQQLIDAMGRRVKT
jgi:hypothetical protein